MACWEKADESKCLYKIYDHELKKLVYLRPAASYCNEFKQGFRRAISLLALARQYGNQ